MTLEQFERMDIHDIINEIANQYLIDISEICQRDDMDTLSNWLCPIFTEKLKKQNEDEIRSIYQNVVTEIDDEEDMNITQNPKHDMLAWTYEVSQQKTYLGYEDWVALQVRREEV